MQAIDTMADSFQREFAAWPTRLFVVLDGRLVYKAQVGPTLGTTVGNERRACSWRVGGTL